MKLTATLGLTAATVASVAAAQPHGHQHRHAHLVPRDVTVTDNVPGPTVIAYELNGQQIPSDEVCAGIADGDLKWADGAAPANACQSSSSSSATPTSTYTPPASTSSASSAWSSPAASSSAAANEFFAKPSSSSAWAASSAAASSTGSWSSSGTGLTSPFPDGQVDCSSFPSDYGAIALDYLGFGGWSGVQGVTISGNAVSNIVTAISGSGCTEGSMCSYACPPGYQKAQWPSTQGSTGQSVGGLSCSGGKLHLTNSALSSSLCIEGTGNVQATNNAGSVVAICRTDYPGTESETIPTEIQAGSTSPLTCPDAGNYYTWEGMSTSAQYYLNPPGYSAAQACQWGSPGQDIGNYAPINFGVGSKSGTTWLSIQANTPTTNAVYPGSVEIQGNLSGSCKYENGQYCSDTGCNSAGCTVSSSCCRAIFCLLTMSFRSLSSQVLLHTSLHRRHCKRHDHLLARMLTERRLFQQISQFLCDQFSSLRLGSRIWNRLLHSGMGI